MIEFVFVLCVINLLVSSFAVYRIIKIQIPPVVLEKEKEETTDKPPKEEQWETLLAYSGGRKAD